MRILPNNPFDEVVRSPLHPGGPADRLAGADMVAESTLRRRIQMQGSGVA
jgi:hypothetical protein